MKTFKYRLEMSTDWIQIWEYRIQITFLKYKYSKSRIELLHKKAVSHVINNRALTGEKPCVYKAIHALLTHGYATFIMIVPGPQISCRYKMCTARP